MSFSKSRLQIVAKGVLSETGVLSGLLCVVSGEPANWMNKVR